MILAIIVPVTTNTRIKQKMIDNGGSGAYKAEAREEKSFRDAVVYKPVDMKAAAPLMLAHEFSMCNNEIAKKS